MCLKIMLVNLNEVIKIFSRYNSFNQNTYSNQKRITTGHFKTHLITLLQGSNMLITKNNIFQFKNMIVGLIEVIIALLLHNEMNL